MILSEKNKLIFSVAGGLLLFILIEKYFIKKRKVLDEKKSNIDGAEMNPYELLNSWKRNIDTQNLDGVVNDYSEDAILLATFGKQILYGSNSIKGYFNNLFKKENLSVEFSNPEFVQKFKEVYIVAGVYNFNYTENNVKKVVKARYTFVLEPINGVLKIAEQHSSIVPN